VRRDIVLALSSMGFEIEMSHHEVAESQHEIDFKYADALTTADRVMTFKFATKAIALKYGLHASFMAKPLAGINGSGMHTHGSLAKNGKNAFYRCKSQRRPVRHRPLLHRRSLKARKGDHPGSKPDDQLVPPPRARLRSTLLYSWSTTNRSALIRVPAARGNSTRAEFRSPDPMCNPYLTFACMLAAGLDGVKNKIMPPDSTNTNIYHLTPKERKKRKIDMLPGSLAEAHQYLLKDKVLCDVLGPHILETLTNIAEAETDAFRLTVHPWELDRYLATY